MTIVRNWIVPQIEPRTGTTNPPLITTASLPNALQGSAYSFQMSAVGGVPPYTWSITSDSPNSGNWLSIDPVSGTLSGTPGTAEIEAVWIKVTDSLSTPTAPTGFSLTVNSGSAIGGPQALFLGNVGLQSASFGILPPSSGTPNSYNVYRNGAKVYTGVTTTGATGPAIPYVEDRQPLTSGTTYSWFATAVTAGIESGPSPTITATTLTPGSSATPIPPAPLNWIAPFALPTGTVWTCTNTASSAVAGTGTLGNVGCSLNWAINGDGGITNSGYSPGDLIVLTAGAVYQTGTAAGYSFPNKANPNNLWTYVISSETPGYSGGGGTLPASLFTTALGGGVQDYSGTGGNWVTAANAAAMPHIEATVGNGVGITLQSQANFLRFVGLWLSPPPGGSGPLTFTGPLAAGATSGTLAAPFSGVTGTTSNYSLVFSDNTARNVNLTNGSTAVSWSPALVNSVTASAGWQLKTWSGNYGAQMPFPDVTNFPNLAPCESIYFDRCRFGLPVSSLYAASNGFTFSTNGLSVYGNHTLIQQCLFEGFCDNFQQTGSSPFYGFPSRESHGVLIVGGSNICVRNCQVEAVSECIFGGGLYISQNFPPSDITISHNFIWKNPVWFTNGGIADIKNFMEFKCGRRINVHHNVCTNNATGLIDPQGARSAIFWASDTFGRSPWVATSDVDFHDNVTANSGGGTYFSGSTGGVTVGAIGIAWADNSRMRSANNIFFLSPVSFTGTGALNSTAHPWCIQIGYGVPDTIIESNTTIIDTSNANWQPGTFFNGIANGFTQGIGKEFSAALAGTPWGRQLYSDRITVRNNILDGTSGAFSGNGLGHGLTTFQTIFPNTAAAPASATVANNLYIADNLSYTGNDFPSVPYASVGFGSFAGNTAAQLPLPQNLWNWNVITAHAQSSTTSTPVGAHFAQPLTQVFNFANFTGATTIATVASTTITSTLNLIPVGSGHASGAGWYKTQQNIVNGFTTTFTFQFTPAMTVPTVAGFTFCVQNTNPTDNPVANGLGFANDANNCGYGSGTGNNSPAFNTIAIKFDANALNQNSYAIGGSPNTTGLYVNGGYLSSDLIPANDMAPYGINLYNGNVFQATVVYDGATITWTLRDTVTGAQMRQSAALNIPNSTGSVLNWVGFTAGTVTTSAAIEVLSWQFSLGANPVNSTPLFSPLPGQYATTQSVKIVADDSATVYYTTNGLLPTTASTLYTGTPITVSANTIIQAIAVRAGFTDSAVGSALYQIGTSKLINRGSGFAAGDGMVLSGSAFRSGSAIQLTDTNTRANGGLEAGSAFWALPVNITSFSTAFTLTFTSAQANGLTFCIQNPGAAYTASQHKTVQAPAGPNIVAFSQSGMGYGPDEGPGSDATTRGIPNSIAVAFDLFHVPNSVGFYTGGVTPQGSQVAMTGIDLTTGHPMNVSLSYDGTTLSLSVTDSVTSTSFSTTFAANIPSLVGGNTAYAGFTAGTGGLLANMSVTKWTW